MLNSITEKLPIELFMNPNIDKMQNYIDERVELSGTVVDDFDDAELEQKPKIEKAFNFLNFAGRIIQLRLMQAYALDISEKMINGTIPRLVQDKGDGADKNIKVLNAAFNKETAAVKDLGQKCFAELKTHLEEIRCGVAIRIETQKSGKIGAVLYTQYYKAQSSERFITIPLNIDIDAPKPKALLEFLKTDLPKNTSLKQVFKQKVVSTNFDQLNTVEKKQVFSFALLETTQMLKDTFPLPK